ncbi:MAG: hypothetical protein QOK16_3635 [Solirubrobacteraceae bacterium]|jgi:hypothetical protein|nr:hypothetical protein [Solirubrobacteraceae bacterium]
MTCVDWNAPLNATGEERSAALRTVLGLRTPHLDAFIAALDSELSADAWGYPQLAEVEDVEQRARVSDQLLSAASGLRDALTDVHISVREFIEQTGPNGLPFADGDDTLNDMLGSEQLQRALASFFRSVGTALDCLAACAIVVARLPVSVQMADINVLIKLDAEEEHKKVFRNGVPAEQRGLWRDLASCHANASAAGPRDWLAWALETRNALTHRGRVTSIYVPRPVSGQLRVDRKLGPHRFRYDLHLRRRPWLPEIESMLAAGRYPDTWISEPAQQTIGGIAEVLVAYCEALVEWCRREWALEVRQLEAPIARWMLHPAPEVHFEGIAPARQSINAAIGGINTEYFALAERLRVRHLTRGDQRG